VENTRPVVITKLAVVESTKPVESIQPAAKALHIAARDLHIAAKALHIIAVRDQSVVVNIPPSLLIQRKLVLRATQRQRQKPVERAPKVKAALKLKAAPTRTKIKAVAALVKQCLFLVSPVLVAHSV